MSHWKMNNMQNRKEAMLSPGGYSETVPLEADNLSANRWTSAANLQPSGLVLVLGKTFFFPHRWKNLVPFAQFLCIKETKELHSIGAFSLGSWCGKGKGAEKRRVMGRCPARCDFYSKRTVLVVLCFQCPFSFPYLEQVKNHNMCLLLFVMMIFWLPKSS